MNFRQLFSDPRFDEICIPRLQRDYAQGRRNTKVDEIRSALLKDIFSGKEVRLNMIFGEGDCKTIPGKNRFIPIDGQQRLTTLFLLHLYGQKTGRSDCDGLMKFTYETRQSSRDFIRAITQNDWPGNIDKDSFEDTIKNQGWFHPIWETDPTVCGMLVMLGDIHRFALTNPWPDTDRITFDFEDLNSLGLNETLYLKMNSRGLELSNFEIMKCSIEAELPKEVSSAGEPVFEDIKTDILPDGQFAEKWKWCMDRSWTEWFWNPEKKEGESFFLRFILAYTMGFLAAESPQKTDEKITAFRDWRKRLDSNTLTWKSITSGAGVDKMPVDYYAGLARLLCRVTKTSGKFESAWGDLYDFRYVSDLELKTRAILYALSCYRGKEFSGTNFEEWLRVCFNLGEYVDSEETFIAYCNQINELSPLSEDTLANVAQLDAKSERLKQEKIKAQLLLRGVRAVREAEAHQLFRGNIRQLLVDANNNFTDIFNSIKWKHINEYFSEEGSLREAFATDFIVAFLKSCWHKEELSSDSDLLSFSAVNVRDRINFRRYVGVFHRVLAAPDLPTVTTLTVQDSDEWNQYRNAIAFPEVIDSLRNSGKNMQLDYKGMEFLLCKGSWRSSNYYISLDYIDADGKGRYRNAFLRSIGYDKNRVAKNHDLFWVADAEFCFEQKKFRWTIWNWIFLLDDNGNHIKAKDGKELCINPYNDRMADLPKLLRRLIAEGEAITKHKEDRENEGASF